MKLVMFKDGKYGIRRWRLFIGYEFADIASGGRFWWSQESEYFKDCRAEQEPVFKIFCVITDKGTPIDTPQKVMP